MVGHHSELVPSKNILGAVETSFPFFVIFFLGVVLGWACFFWAGIMWTSHKNYHRLPNFVNWRDRLIMFQFKPFLHKICILIPISCQIFGHLAIGLWSEKSTCCLGRQKLRWWNHRSILCCSSQRLWKWKFDVDNTMKSNYQPFADLLGWNDTARGSRQYRPRWMIATQLWMALLPAVYSY